MKKSITETIDTRRWTNFLMDNAVSIHGADTEKVLTFLAEVVATIYITRGNGTANDYVTNLMDVLDECMKIHNAGDETDFTTMAKEYAEKNKEATQLATFVQNLLLSIGNAGVVKNDSVLPIYTGVYMGINHMTREGMIAALTSCVSYVLVDPNNGKDLNDLSVLIMDAITDKSFQKTVKYILEAENRLRRRR